MTTTNEHADMALYKDSMDYDVARRGQEYAKADIEKYFCIRDFINAAYANVLMGLNNAIHANGVPDEVMFDFTFHHGHEDSEDNHNDTVEQVWSLEYKYHGKGDGQGTSFTFWFPCKLFWMRRAEIEEWFKDEASQIANFTQWMKRRGILHENQEDAHL